MQFCRSSLDQFSVRRNHLRGIVMHYLSYNTIQDREKNRRTGQITSKLGKRRTNEYNDKHDEISRCCNNETEKAGYRTG